MDKRQIKDYTKLFLQGKLSSEQEVDLLRWIKQSPENKKLFYFLQQTFESELNVRSDEPLEKSWKYLAKRVSEKNNTIPIVGYLKKYYQYAAPLTAALIIGFFLATLLFWNINKQSKIAVVQQKISTPYGARSQFMLPDSSLVWLNSGSEILFPLQFDSERPVQLTGEAFFEVKKSDIPFTVSTEYGEIEVKGTSFNVQAYENDFFKTTLVNGKIQVLTGNKERVELLPGYQAVSTENGLEVNPVETELFTSWKEGKLIFREEYLPELANRLERWYNVKIELDDDPHLQGIKYSGTIEMETFMEVLNLISITAPVNYTWNEKTRVIKLFYENK